MDREHLSALRDALDVVLAWPDSIRSEIARWLMPEASKPNGVDHNPGPGRGVPTRLIAPNPRPTKARRHSKFNVQTAERRLIEAMQGSPGLSVAALAKTTSTSRSTTGEWLRQLAARGAIEKDPEGRWRLKGEEPRPTEAREQPDPTIAPSS